MTDQLLEVLRAADPARRMPPVSSATREAIREGILAAGTDGRQRSLLAASHGSNTRRPRMMAAAAILVVLIPLGGWAYVSHFSGRQAVVDEFRAAQQQMPLPAGAAGAMPDLPADASFGSKSGFIAAWSRSTRAWLEEWLAAHKAGDHAREQAAITAVERQVDLMPLHKDGDPEETGGFDQGSIDYMKALIVKMKRGEPADIEHDLQVNP